MKKMFSGMVIALALVLVLVIGVVALAENAGDAQLPEAGELQPAPEAQQPEEDATAQQDAAAQQDSTALQEALNALREARQSAHEEDLQEELDGYVADGKLTREQADTIMNYYKERNALRNGTCPSCGYQFGNGQGKGGRGNGFGGMNGGMNGNMKGNGGQRGGRRGGFGGQGMNGGFGGQQPGMQDPVQPNAFNEGI